jgi:two-component system chemotaxis sensor kinase CheA
MPTSAAKGALPLGEILTDSGVVAPVVVNAALEKQQKARDSRPPDASFLRVDAEKLDHLIELVGELVVANAGVQMLGQAEGAGPLAEAAEILARLVEEVRDVTLSLRMVQIGPTFQRFQRVVRDVSRELGKEIELVITGAETELDKTVVERIGDPLMHLVRNAMDHGIEPLDRRLAAGKPARAVLRLNAHHDAGSIVIEVSDDGGGLNRPKIRSKAIERGLIPPDAVLTDREIDQLIFMPGFSTADQVSNLSGRGVGMDVVRRDIEALRGSVEIDSTPGVGTTIRIRLPLTLAIIDGFLVGIGNSRYVLPVDLIVECVELPMSDRAAILERGYMDLRGEVLPIIWLRELLDLQHVPAARRENVLVLQFGRTRVGLVVDVLLGEHQTVIRPLGRLFAALKGVSGSTILGGGEVALILDVPGLVELGRLRERQGAAPAQRMNHEIAR